MKWVRFTLTILVIIFFNSIIAYANTLILPKPKGPYGVGTVNVELCDGTRTQLKTHEKRRWMATIFYPTLKTKATAPYMPGTLEDGNVRGTKVLQHAVPCATMIKNHKFPIIISFPGRGGERQKATILYQTLASHGYSVITMDQPYVANFVKFPDGEKTVLTFKDLWNFPRNRDYRYQYDNAIIESAIQDIDFVLQNWDTFGTLSKSFDLNKIILMGHSIGANIAHIKGFSDKRIKAVIDIDSKITERAIFGHIGVPQKQDAKPVLFIRGMMQYQENVEDRLTKISHSTIWSPQVEHSAFSDDAFFSGKIPGYGMKFWGAFYNWFFKKGPYFSNIDTNLGHHKADEWFEAYPKYVVQWLNKQKL